MTEYQAPKVETLYSPQEVANILRISVSGVYGLIRAGDLEAIKIGPKMWRISKQALKRFLKGKE